MSGSDKSGKSDTDDPVGGRLGSAGSSQSSNSSSTNGPSTDEQNGLNPLDLLGLPADQRDLITWLVRHKQARWDDIRDGLAIKPAHLTALLSALVRDQVVQEALIDGELYYRVMFRGQVSRAARGLSDELWDRVDLDNSHRGTTQDRAEPDYDDPAD